ncbi:MAG: hypothetical protein QOF33_4788, partial [Thermomicrobiales bacterium]|nr:hypothetical protein [Thermomicrobiales bacterium]
MNKLVRTVMAGASALAVAAVAFAGSALAARTVVVTPSHTHGWYEADVRPGGAINYINDPSSPYPSGALQLLTDGTTAAKAQYLNKEHGRLSRVRELSYWTKQVSGPPEAAASYQLVVDLNGRGTGGFTTFVYEPYWNGTVVPGTWQQWDVGSGKMWSSSTFAEGTCVVAAGAGGPPFYTLAQLQAMCPKAAVLAFGVNDTTRALLAGASTGNMRLRVDLPRRTRRPS